MTGFPDFTQKKKKSSKSLWIWGGMFILFFAFLMFGQAALVPQATATPTAAPSAEQTPAATPEGFLPDYQSTLDPNLATIQNDDRSFAQIALDIGWKLGLVIVLMYGLLLGLRWLQKFKNPIKTSGATIQVLETIGLAPGRSLHLIVVGEKTLLLGSTEQNIALLTELADAHIPLPEEEIVSAEPASAPEPTPEFVPAPTPAPTPAPLPATPPVTPSRSPSPTFADTLDDAVSVEISRAAPQPDALSNWQSTLNALRSNVQTMRDSVGAE